MSQPPRSPKEARLAAGTLLLAQADTEKRTKAAAHAVAVEAAADAEQSRQHGRATKASLLALALLYAKRMALAVGAALLAGRQSARERASDRAIAELGAIGIVLGGGRRLIAAARQHRWHEDNMHAQSSAESLATAWRGLVVHGVSRAIRTDADPVMAVRQGGAQLGPRIRRTSVTETAQAYSDEHRQAIADAVRYDAALAASLRNARVVREWVAMLDACSVCWPHDGEQAEIGEPFSGGDEPGAMHPHCMCTDIYTTANAAFLAA